MCPINIKLGHNQYKSVTIEELGYQHIRNSQSYIHIELTPIQSSNIKMHNKLEFNQHLTNKKGLYRSMKNYYEAIGANIFEYIPLTFHIQQGESDPEFINFIKAFNEINQEKSITRSQNVWIIKPGENSNRGQGITVCNTLDQIKSLINSNNPRSSTEKRTYIIQKYLEKPFLIHKRKFDFRCYGLITSFNGILQGYFYSDGYLRTTSCEYNIKEISNNFMHLTNDAIQKYSEDYGKFEDANKLSYRDFQRYLDHYCQEKKINFIKDILPKIKNLAKDTMQSVFLKIDPNRRLHCMEIFGYDFMLDNSGKV